MSSDTPNNVRAAAVFPAASIGPTAVVVNPWTRPRLTACDTPNPPRNRTSPIAFASNAFHPNGWSPPVSRAVSAENVSLASRAQEQTGAPAIIYAPVQTHIKAPELSYAAREEHRTEAMTFASTSFHHDEDKPPVVVMDQPGSPHTPSSDEGSTDDLLLSPTDSVVMRPLPPSRRRTEPIGLATNGWRLDLPAKPLQIDTRVVSPTDSNTDPFDWAGLYVETRKDAERRKACTKWMNKVSAPPKETSPIAKAEENNH